ncbi:DUF6498-containing protein [Halobellus ruber]|uniref:Uncharacterized protein n=1 Tax=Halobellus ruber TaxID=2761102 RepID=A0A7J9SFN7_9EURY|nr:DUF6498-containing protein [Halobellus ruber]MBB6645750.1 hypothetical protein [Halobellus ruber]
MQQLFPPHASRPDVKLFSIFVANSVPVVGLLAFDTSAAALLIFYWLELGVVMLWTIVRALFAGKPPGKEAERDPFSGPQWATLRFILPDRFFGGDDSTSDGGWRAQQIPLPRTDVGIHLGTIPALVVVIFLLTVVWAGFGGVVAGPVVAAANGTGTPMWPLTGAGVVFVSQGGRTVTEYFYRGGYRDATVWTAAKGVFYEGFVLVGAGLLVLLSVYASTDGEAAGLESAASGPIIFTVIATKFLIDLTVYYIDTLDKPLRDLVVPD